MAPDCSPARHSWRRRLAVRTDVRRSVKRRCNTAGTSGGWGLSCQVPGSSAAEVIRVSWPTVYAIMGGFMALTVIATLMAPDTAFGSATPFAMASS